MSGENVRSPRQTKPGELIEHYVSRHKGLIEGVAVTMQHVNNDRLDGLDRIYTFSIAAIDSHAVAHSRASLSTLEDKAQDINLNTNIEFLTVSA